MNEAWDVMYGTNSLTLELQRMGFPKDESLSLAERIYDNWLSTYAGEVVVEDSASYRIGRHTGYDDGYSDGFDEGLSEGREQGFDEGYTEGLEHECECD